MSKENKKDIPKLTANQMADLLANAQLTRSALFEQLLNIGKDINAECGYPGLLPEESWAMNPEIQETENTVETVFEKDFKKLQRKHRIWHYLQRIDVLSGIGEFGVLLIGISDGKELNEPVEGINEVTGEKIGNQKYELLYLRPFDQSVIKIKTTESDITSPRFGMPKTYEIIFTNDDEHNQIQQGQEVHWSRLIHIADNRHTSEVRGRPRQMEVYNRLLDIRKIVAGSGEMFWKGAFPGLSLEANADQADAVLDKEGVREEMSAYMAGMQRYLALQGMTAKSLAPQVADPRNHLLTQINYIAITLGVPLRLLMGSEQAQLASGQDVKTWNKRVEKRRSTYVTPLVISPFIDRLITFGILPEVDDYKVVWPDLNTPTDAEKADIAAKKTESFAKYVGGNVDALIAPKEYLMLFHDFTEDQANAIGEAAMNHIEDAEEDAEEENEENYV